MMRPAHNEMPLPTRRDFLRAFSGAVAASALAGLSRPGVAQNTYESPFRMLVLGDSLVWGQGLEESDKFYTLTRDWLESEVFGGRRKVELVVKAHSGATVKLEPEESEGLRRGDYYEGERLHPELNVAFPTIEKQVKQAAAHYGERSGDVGLILATGGIPDVGVAKIINPFESDKRLRDRIRLYCHDHMLEVLGTAADAFPGAVIVLGGYYPIIGPRTPVKRIVNDVLELYDVPGWAKPLVNNPVGRLEWRRLKRRMVRRSRIWHEESDAAFREVAAAVNRRTGTERIHFVPSPITEDHAYGVKDSMLFTVGRKGRPADEMAERRIRECNGAFAELRRRTRLKYKSRFCELASIGHPTPAGSAAIADSIRIALASHFEGSRLAGR